jgi:amino acid transporter
MENENKIGIITAAIVGMNAMIGAGMATFPTVLSGQVGPAGILSCLFSVALILCIGLSLGRTAEILPGEGWNYLFILMSLVLAGAHTSSWAQYVIAGFVLIPLILTGTYCWFHFNPKLLVPFMPYGVTSIFQTSSIIMFAFGGFESIISLYAIVRNPTKNVPRAFMLAISGVGLFYLFFFYGVLFAIPKHYFVAGLQEPLSAVLAKFFPTSKILSNFVWIGAMFGIIGTLHSMIWSLSTLFTSVLKKAKGKIIQTALNKNIWNDKVSVIVTTAAIGLTSLLLHEKALLPLTIFFIVISYVLSIATLLFVKKEWISWHNIITLIGICGGGLMFYFATQIIISTLF